jgi:Holliday junction DNA helicase RuvA
MIAWVEGVLREKAPTRIVVDVHGVGYELLISLHTYSALPDAGKTVSLHVHTAMRSESIALFGFARALERDVFELLLRTSRVGPKLAQTVLSGMDPESLLAAIQSSDVVRLVKVPGVGKKLAERLIVELRERAAELGALAADDTPHGAAAPAAHDEALSALVNLGYPRAKAERVVELAAEEAGEDASIDSLIRAALRSLAG